MAAVRKPIGSGVLLGEVLMSRATCGAVVFAGAGHLLLTTFGLGGWPCPVMSTLGIPCPGCGLSRAALLLLRGHWQAAFELHAFAPVLLLFLGGLAAGLLMPDSIRRKVAAAVARFESQTRLTQFLLLSLLLYWLWRFTLDGSRFLQVGELFNNT